MGRSDKILSPKYHELIGKLIGADQPKQIACLGSPSSYFVTKSILTYSPNAKFEYYDLELKNWNINSKWALNKIFDLIVCTRCPYFAQNPLDFIQRCYNHLSPNGLLLVDWGLGDHLRFSNYKIGWVKNKEQEYCYGDQNYLWSGIWDDSFLDHPQFKTFSLWVEKLGYNDVKKAIFEETPSILHLSDVKKYFDINIDLLALWEKAPQLYIFVSGKKIKN